MRGILNQNKKGRRKSHVDQEPFGANATKWGFRQLSMQLDKWKLRVIQHLEHIDAGLSARQRKWLFYIGLLCWSSFLFYLLGTAIRRPPASFVLPFAADSSQLSLRQFNSRVPERVPEEHDIIGPLRTGIVAPTVTHTDYSPLKINSHGTNQVH